MSKIIMHTSMLKMYFLFALCCVVCTHSSHFTQACSSRTVPKPRPSTSSSSSISATAPPPTILPLATRAPITASTTTTPTTTSSTTTTVRPNITFPTYKCPDTYDAWYCLNEATCFSVRIGDSIMYNCECAIGFMGPRCEYKELDGSYLPKRPHPMLEKASIASGAICALLFMLFVCLTLYLRYDQRPKMLDEADNDDEEDEEEEEVCGAAAQRTFACKDYKCQQCCCCMDSADAAGSDTDLLVSAEKYRHSSTMRQHIATLPMMSFAFRRSAKL